MDFFRPIPFFFHQPQPITDTAIPIFLSQYLEPIIPWKSRVFARAQFEFDQRVTLGTSNILVYILGVPWPRTLLNHIDVSIQAGQKCCCFTNRIRQESYLLVSSTGLDTSPLVFFCYFQMHAWCRPSSWAIFITRCQTLQLSRCGSGFPG